MKRLTAKVFAALLSIGFTLVLVEIGLRLAGYPPSRADHQRMFVEHDTLRGWRSAADTSGFLSTAEYRVDLEYNERGFRGPLPTYEKPRSTDRVLLLGDSFVEGYTEAQEDRVSEVLEEELSGRLLRRRVEVIALGTAGYSTDQELLWLRTDGVRYEPDVVVLLFHPNDVWYNTQSRYSRGAKPRFEFRDDTLALTGVPVPPPGVDGTDASRDGGHQLDLLTSIGSWLRDTQLYRLASRVGGSVPGLHALAVRIGIAPAPPEMIFARDGGALVPAQFQVYRSDPGPEVEEAWRVTRALLAEIQRTAEAAGAQLLVFYVPLRAEVYSRATEVRRAGRSIPGWDPGAPARRFQSICRQQGLDCLVPTVQFREKAEELAKDGERLYYEYDWHWNARGHRFAAEMLAKRIAPLLEDSAGPVSTP